jgi:hypothetical protein
MPKTLTFADRYGFEILDIDDDMDDDYDSNYDLNEDSDSDDDKSAMLYASSSASSDNDDDDNSDNDDDGSAQPMPGLSTGVDEDDDDDDKDDDDNSIARSTESDNDTLTTTHLYQPSIKRKTMTEITQPCVHTCNGLFIFQLYSLPNLLEEMDCKEDTLLTLPFCIIHSLLTVDNIDMN